MINIKELPTLKSILVITDNFWVGGRETFLADNISVLRKNGLKNISLLASNINNDLVSTIFDNHFEIGTIDTNLSSRWLSEGEKIIELVKPDFIWVQHYCLLPALILSSQFNIPLHITLHGPLNLAGYRLPDALAFTLAIHRGASVSGVSYEIINQILKLYNNVNCIGVLPNKVLLPENIDDEKKSKPQSNITFAIFTRQDKLEHLRQALLIVSAFSKSGHDVILNVYTGITIENSYLSSTNKISLFLKLFGKKWLTKNNAALQLINKVNIHNLTNKVTKAMENSDVILGMGRVVLEGLACKKSVILIGYNQVIGNININNFQKYQHTNFSGRGLTPNNYKYIINETIEAINQVDGQRDELSDMVSINRSSATLFSLVVNAAESKPMASLSNELTRFTLQQLNGDVDNQISNLFTSEELITLEKLKKLNSFE